jgi:hypothetical protein
MFNPRSLLVALLCGSALIACSDEVGNRPDPELPEDIPAQPTQINIQNTLLPIHETFNVTGPNGGIAFFNPTYKELQTCPEVELTAEGACELKDDEGNPVLVGTLPLVDTLPSFYYPTCCFFDTFDDGPNAGQQRRPPLEDPPAYEIDMDFRLKVADNKMAISNGRFTIGQIYSDLASLIAVDRKINTSETTGGVSNALGGWGELDLSQPYRISYCLADNGLAGAGGSGNTEVYVDNNSGGNQAHSFHSNFSLLMRVPTTSFVRGNRVVLDVPGEVRQVDNTGARVGDILTLNNHVGSFRSFLQLRVSSGTYAVMSDLVIEYQSDRTVTELVTALPCTADTAFFDPPSPKDEREIAGLPGTPYVRPAYTPGGLILTVNATAGEAEFFAQLGGENDAGTTTGDYLAISDDQFDNFYKEVGSATRIFVDAAENAVRFGNALWTMGLREGAQDDGVVVNGDIDLSTDYRITAEIVTLPIQAGYRLQVQTDNATGTGANSIHGAASRIANLIAADGLELGTLVINVPGEITMNGVQLTTMNGVALADPDFAVPALVGTDTSFIAFRCPSECGNASETEGGISLGDIVVEYQP